MSKSKTRSGYRERRSNRYIKADAGKLIGAIITETSPDKEGMVRLLAVLLMSTKYGEAADTVDELIDSFRELHRDGWMDVDSDGMAWVTSPMQPSLRVSASKQMSIAITDCPPDFLP